jgi:hypothetical protein
MARRECNRTAELQLTSPVISDATSAHARTEAVMTFNAALVAWMVLVPATVGLGWSIYRNFADRGRLRVECCLRPGATDPLTGEATELAFP